MNAIGFVFFILSILSIGAFVSLEKQMGTIRLRSSSLGHLHANRDILNQCESKRYKSLKKPPSSGKKQEKKKPKEPSVAKPPAINPECARFNLFPLLEQGAKKEPLLYQTAAALLKTFYAESLLQNKPRVEYQFLDAWLQAARKMNRTGALGLEKIQFSDKPMQSLYYRMLKGTKRGALYPALVDLFKIDSSPSPICLCHAHPILLNALFSPKAGAALYNAIHTPNEPMPDREAVERICLDAHLLVNPALFDLLDLHRNTHSEFGNKTLIGEDDATHISLKKTIVLGERS